MAIDYVKRFYEEVVGTEKIDDLKEECDELRRRVAELVEERNKAYALIGSVVEVRPNGVGGREFLRPLDVEAWIEEHSQELMMIAKEVPGGRGMPV